MEKYNISKSIEWNHNLKNYLPSGKHHNYSKADNETSIHFIEGLGSMVWDADKNSYLDLYAKFGAMFLGHKNRGLLEAITTAVHKYPITDYTELDSKVCEYFHRYVPCCEKIRFCLSGTEAIQNAIRLARAYTKKRRIIRFEGHFHGSADNIMGGKTNNILCPIVYEDPDSVFHTEGRASAVLQDQMLMLPWNDIEILNKMLKNYGADIAAIIMEPVNMNGGGIMPYDNYLEQVRSLCDEYQVVLIFDEVITGIHMGLGGAQNVFKVTPDLCVMGKAITSGIVPVSAIMGSSDIMNLMEENRVAFGGTFNGYNIGMAAVEATFRILSENEDFYYNKIKDYASQISKILHEEGKYYGIDLITQGPPACFTYHCTDKPIEVYNQYNDTIMQKDRILRQCMLQYGIIACHTSRMYMNISISDKDIEFFTTHLRPALQTARQIFDRLKL